MKKEENITLTPLNEGMTYDSSSWLVINVQSNKKTEVIFYTAKQDMENSFSDFKEFSNFIIDEKFEFYQKDNEANQDINNKKSTISGCIVKEEDDCDEDRRKSFKVLVAESQLIDVYQNIAFEDIANLVKESKKALKLLEENEKESYKETQEYRKDPYSYYGVSQSDFF